MCPALWWWRGHHRGVAARGQTEVTILVDSQLETDGLHPLVRGRTTDEALSISLQRIPDNSRALIAVEYESKTKGVALELSSTTGKRLVFRIDLAGGSVVADELQPWGPAAQTGYRSNGSLTPGGVLDGKFNGAIVGGPSQTDLRHSYRGRVAEFAIFDRLLPDDRIEALRAASAPESERDVPRYERGAFDDEARKLLLDGYTQLLEFHNRGRLSRAELLAFCGRLTTPMRGTGFLGAASSTT